MGTGSLGSQVIDLTVFGVRVRVVCTDDTARRWVTGNFGAFETAACAETPDCTYTIEVADGNYVITSAHRGTQLARDVYELVYYIEKSVTIDVQLRRTELFFVHAAALERGGRACLLVAPPGSGKSTTAWAMIHEGFHYMSDELAPIALDSLAVVPYPHALCLKRSPPAPYDLPVGTLDTGRTLHVPAAAIAAVAGAPTTTVPLGTICFVRYDATAKAPSAKPIAGATASAALYANGLNQLAHAGDGLAAAVTIAAAANCYAVTTADLAETCQLLRSLVDR